MRSEGAEYGNWVSVRFIVVPTAVAIPFAVGAACVPGLGLVAALFLLTAAYFTYARRVLSPRGRRVQDRMVDLVLSRFPGADWEGRVLDIGCGSGALAIRIAKLHPRAAVLGVDTWGAAWGSSQRLCERNVEAEGVGERVSFESASAASLPFDDGSFDAVVSNLVFHEVHGVRDKRRLLAEALRVLRPGGVFVFQDLFLWRRIYGPIDDLLEEMRGWGLGKVELVDTSRSSFIPTALKLPFMLGAAGILYGRK